MKKTTDKEKDYKSISRKITERITVLLFCFTVIFSVYIFTSMQSNALKRYSQETTKNSVIAGENIEYYMNNIIFATKSVYINHKVMNLLKTYDAASDVENIRTELGDYFKSIYYASSGASQIFLVVPEKGLRFLYLPRQLDFTYGSYSEITELPDLKSFSDVYISSTHQKTDYGLDIPVINQFPLQENVLTIWLPIADLPVDKKPFAYLAVDLPVSFIMENCRLTYNQEEKVYILDLEDKIVASSETASIGQNFTVEYPMFSHDSNHEAQKESDGNIYIKTQLPVRYVQWKMVKVAPANQIYTLTRAQMLSMLLLFIVLVGILIGLILFQIIHFIRPIQRVTEYMEEIRARHDWKDNENLSETVRYKENDEISSLISSFDGMMQALRTHEIQRYELRIAYIRAELKTMQAQINPHFIYNVIQCFATNSLKDKDMQQYSLISSFGQMLHYAMTLDPVNVSVSKEIEYVKRYISLQEMRFAKKLHFTAEIEERCEDIKIPKMTIQPLIENSIVHGALMQKEGKISLRVFQNETNTYIEVKDNGKGITDHRVQEIANEILRVRHRLSDPGITEEERRKSALQFSLNTDKEKGSFIGIENVFSRLYLGFGNCEFSIYANEIGGTTVILFFPCSPVPFPEILDEAIDCR